MKKTPVILDADAGVDDALAIVLALSSPELEVKAITTVSGNVPVDQCTKNVLRVLSLMQATEVLVAKGESRPLKKPLFTAASVHGQDGLGDLGEDYYPALRWALLSPAHATDLIPHLVAERPGEVVVVATGPLTNVARAIQKAPNEMAKVKQIVAMGGAIYEPGNIRPLNAAEFNVYVDPDALRVVLDFGAPFTLVPLDVTHRVKLMRGEARRKLASAPDRVSRFIFDCSQRYMDFHLKESGMDGAYIHDALAVGTVIDPTLVQLEQMRLYVETRRGMTRGMTIPFRPIKGGHEDYNCRVALAVDHRRFLEMFLARAMGRNAS